MARAVEAQQVLCDVAAEAAELVRLYISPYPPVTSVLQKPYRQAEAELVAQP